MKKLLTLFTLITTLTLAQTPLECLQSDIDRQIGYEKTKQEIPKLLQEIIDTKVPPSELEVIKEKIKDTCIKSMVNINHINEKHGDAIPPHIKSPLDTFMKQDRDMLLLVEKF